MKEKLSGTLILVMLAAACGRGSMTRDQKSYETVEEGSAAGVTSTIQGPGETLPPITGTNADTTSAFTIDPNTVAGATNPTPAYDPAPYPTTTYPTTTYASTPPPRTSTQAPVRPPTTTAEPEPEPEPEKTETTTTTAEPPPSSTDTAATSTEEPPPPPPPPGHAVASPPHS